jgi:hypothetical protein
MPGRESGGTSREGPGVLEAEELLARLQELVDSKPTEGPCPLEWAVSAYFLGDMSGLAGLSLCSGGGVPPEAELA